MTHISLQKARFGGTVWTTWDFRHTAYPGRPRRQRRSQPQAVMATSPAIIIDVLTDHGLNRIAITAKGVGGLFPVSSKTLTARTEEFQSRVMVCLK